MDLMGNGKIPTKQNWILNSMSSYEYCKYIHMKLTYMKIVYVNVDANVNEHVNVFLRVYTNVC